MSPESANKAETKKFSMLNMSLGFFGSIEPSMRMWYFHRHNEIEINFSRDYSFEYLLDGKKAYIPKQTMVVFWALKPHSIIWAESQKSMHYHITIPLPWFLGWKLPGSFVHNLLAGELLAEPDKDRCHFDEHLITTWCRDLKTNSPELHQATICEIQGRMMRLAFDIYHDSTGPNFYEYPDNSVEKVAAMTKYIAEHASEPLQVSDVAKSVDLHPSYATTLFRQTCGINIMKFIIAHKISLAQILLVSTDKKVINIAYESGFGSSSQFYEHFTTICGISPSQYRRDMLNNHFSHLANHKKGIEANLTGY